MFIRKSNRLNSYNYSSSGYYFITIKTYNSIPFFGSISDGFMSKSKIGVLAEKERFKIPYYSKNVSLYNYIIMPDHIHGILIVNNDVGDWLACPTINKQLIPKIIAGYKAGVSRKIRHLLHQDFKWQRSYFDRVIRNENELSNIREYIITNVERKLF